MNDGMKSTRLRVRVLDRRWLFDLLPMVALRAMLVALAMLEVGMPVAAFLVCYHPLLAFFAFKGRSG